MKNLGLTKIEILRRKLLRMPGRITIDSRVLNSYKSILKKGDWKMGLLVNGKWQDQWYDTKASNGAFIRENSSFHKQIVRQASHPDDFPAKSGRYHLFVSYACPWAHRTLIIRKLKQLESAISLSVVNPKMMENGWEFEDNDPSIKSLQLDLKYLHQLYSATEPNYTGRATVPVLWDKKSKMIVNNESSQIIRMLNHSFNDYAGMQFDFYPEALRTEIDEINDYLYENVNNGVYKCGFASAQEAYETAFDSLFDALHALDRRLEKQRFLVGNKITEADWRLFTTLVRFDAVYYSHFKANQKRIADFPQLSQYLKELYQVPGVKETVRMDHIKQHYYYSHTTINPSGIVPKGPELDLESPHDRNRFGSEPLFKE